MEAADPFGAGAPETDEDPFAEAEGGGIATEPDPSAASEEPLPGETADTGMGDPAEGEQPPIVNKEGERVDGSEAAAEPAPAPAAAEPAPEPAPAAEPAPEPEEKKSKAAQETRLYKLLYATGPGQWTEASMDNAPEGAKEVKNGEVWLKARNADHARRMAFVIFGKPDDGVTVVPVAQSSWKPKRVRRRPPSPDKEALEIT